jgi:agmatinase
LSAREGIEFLRGLVGLDIIAVDVNTVSPPLLLGAPTASPNSFTV